MAHIPQKTLQDTCEFIVQSYVRKCVDFHENTSVHEETYQEHYNKLSGISNLYVGKSEHSIVQGYLERIKRARQRQVVRVKNSGVARPSPFSPDEIGEGATQLPPLAQLQAG